MVFFSLPFSWSCIILNIQFSEKSKYKTEGMAWTFNIPLKTDWKWGQTETQIFSFQVILKLQHKFSGENVSAFVGIYIIIFFFFPLRGHEPLHYFSDCCLDVHWLITAQVLKQNIYKNTSLCSKRF